MVLKKIKKYDDKIINELNEYSTHYLLINIYFNSLKKVLSEATF